MKIKRMMRVSDSELEVLKLLWLNNKEISKKLCIEAVTVKSHIHNLLIKLKAKTRTELLVKALFYRIITLQEVIEKCSE